jgi:EipB-like
MTLDFQGNSARSKAKVYMAPAHIVAARSAPIACMLVFAAATSAVEAQEGRPIALVPHRAVYDLTLGQTRENAHIASVRGRILYDFDGNACDGYTLQFRQVSELDTGEGKKSTSDLRSSTWEGGDAKRFNFTSQNFLDQNLVDSVDGHAGKTILDFPVFDGSDTGDKVYDTLTVIGRKLATDERKHEDAAATDPKLLGVARWPVTISYFEKGKKQKSSEQTPAYAISFELYENGISRALSLDYNEFVVTGTLSSLKIRDSKPCK